VVAVVRQRVFARFKAKGRAGEGLGLWRDRGMAKPHLGQRLAPGQSGEHRDQIRAQRRWEHTVADTCRYRLR
jgi:hypothetical protein